MGGAGRSKEVGDADTGPWAKGRAVMDATEKASDSDESCRYEIGEGIGKLSNDLLTLRGVVKVTCVPTGILGRPAASASELSRNRAGLKSGRLFFPVRLDRAASLLDPA